MDKKEVLVVDDDKNICELLSLYLTNAGYSFLFCHDGSAALDILRERKVDLVLLDIMLPVIDGWEVCKMIKSKYAVPVIMLTARDELDDKIQGFNAGADDYIVKPFHPKEVIARIQARLRDSTAAGKAEQDGILSIGGLVVDFKKYEVRNFGKLIELKPKEIQLLYFLLKNRNMVFSRDRLLEQVWNYEHSVDTRTVDMHVKSLREKLGVTGDDWGIRTIWGVGYKLEAK